MLRQIVSLTSIALLLIASGIALNAHSTPASAQEPTECSVDEVDIETIDESVGFVSRVIVEINSQLDTLNTPETVPLYYRTLIDMRQYHEALRDELPDCALPMNQLLIDSIIATQDLLGIAGMRTLLPESTYAIEITAANTYLGERFAALSVERRRTTLSDATVSP